MKRILYLFFILIAALPLISLAQGNTPQSRMTEPSLLDRRVELCIANKLCTTQEQMQLMQGMTDRMQGALERIEKRCATLGYLNCVDSQMNDVILWHKVHDYMRDMMLAMEMQYAAVMKTPAPRLNRIEPAAGPSPYTNPDLEQQERHKGEWWKDWAPPGEGNPYHKW